ncbi:MAG: acyl carrier protein [Candidatus Sericytochromatia bacterium]|nr:acyl carrier protein [Candidatus Tanganyikabacteria bacterium]
MQDIKNQVKAFIRESLLMTDADVPDGASLHGIGVLDSTGVLELVAFLEGRFAIHVADDELRPENLDSLDAIAAFVGGKVRAGARHA